MARQRQTRHDPHEHVREQMRASGLFAVGDVRHGSTKRVATAVGEGAMVVKLVHDHLAHLDGAPT